MLDPRMKNTCHITSSTTPAKSRPGENVLIEIFGDHTEMAAQVVTEVYAAGGYPFVHLRNQQHTACAD